MIRDVMPRTLWSSTNMTRVYVVLLALLILVGPGRIVLAGEPWPPVLRINAAKDLGEVNPLWRDFGQGGESTDPTYLEPTRDLMRALRPRIIRVDHLFDYYVDVKRTGPVTDPASPDTDRLHDDDAMPAHLVADFSALHTLVNVIESMGAEPLLCVSYVPKGLAGKGRVIDPPDAEAWSELVRMLVREMASRDRPIRYYEVWNEPNLDAFWGGTREEFLDLYAVTARVIRDEAPDARIGGAGFAEFAQHWVEALLDRVVRDDLPLDFLSWHKYATSADAVRDQVDLAQELCRARGLDVELILDEWNYDAGLSAGNDDHRSAVYVADHLAHLVETPLSYAPFFEIKDGDDRPDEFWGRWGLITQRHTPKANYFAMLAHQKLGTRRLAMTGEPEGVAGLATLRHQDVVFTLVNRSNEGKWVEIRLENVPGPERLRTWQRWLIDACHSNPSMGAPAALQRVEEEVPFVSARPRDDVSATAKAVFLPPRSVSLFAYEVTSKQDPPIRCEIEWLAEQDGGRWKGFVRLENTSDAAVNVEAVRLWNDQSAPVQVEGWREGQERTVAPRERVDVPFEFNVYPSAVAYVYSIRNAVQIEGHSEVRTSRLLRLDPTLEIALEPRRVPWPAKTQRLPVTLKLINNTQSRLEGNLTWRPDAAIQIEGRMPKRYALTPGEELRSEPEFRIGACPKDRIQPSDLAVETELTGGREGNRTVSSRVRLMPSFDVPRRTVPIRVDGMLDDWSDVPVLSRVPDPQQSSTGNPLKMVCDDEGLWVALTVHDEQHVQLHDDGRMWQGDSVQFAFDVAWLWHDFSREVEGYSDTFLEIALALGPSGPVAWVYEDLWEGENNRRLDIPVAIARMNGQTVYELHMPWSVFQDWNLPMGAAAVINDVDAEDGMRYWSEWGGGVAGRKDPGLFLHLSEAR